MLEVVVSGLVTGWAIAVPVDGVYAALAVAAGAAHALARRRSVRGSAAVIAALAVRTIARMTANDGPHPAGRPRRRRAARPPAPRLLGRRLHRADAAGDPRRPTHRRARAGSRRWRTILERRDNTWSPRPPDGLVGFVSAGPGRDNDVDTETEVMALYVRAGRWGAGVGYALLEAAIGDRRGVPVGAARQRPGDPLLRAPGLPARRHPRRARRGPARPDGARRVPDPGPGPLPEKHDRSIVDP